MAEFLVHVCNAFTGVRVDGFKVSSFSWESLLSARGNANVTIPLTEKQDKDFLRPYLEPWQYLIALERDGVVKYGGYVIPGSYTRGVSSVSVELGDFWAMLGRRIMTAPGVTNIEKWSTTLTGPRALHAATLVALNRDRASTPASTFPMTIPGGWTGESVTRPYRGYEMTYVHDKLSSLMDEGLDILFKPRWVGGVFGWLMQGGDAWVTGVTRELNVTADESDVTEFSERTDGARITNNADRVGEGSEVDLLVRSWPDVSSTLPLLERITMSKSVSDVNQLSALALQDLATYRTATVQWDFKVTAGTEIEVGDTVRMIFDGDLWIPDGIYTRRVVKIAGDMSDQISVSVQPTGGA